MSWVWLDPPSVDFAARPDAPGDTRELRTVRVCADPRRVLGVGPSAGGAETRQAYRRLVRSYHPDLNQGLDDPFGHFQEIQNAYSALDGTPVVEVHPGEGRWWTILELLAEPPGNDGFVVGSITFESDAERDEDEEIRVSYAGETVTLGLAHRRTIGAKLSGIAESAALVVVCLTVIPIGALLLALDMSVLSNGSPVVFWGVATLIVAGGYGSLAAILADTRHPLPRPARPRSPLRAGRR